MSPKVRILSFSKDSDFTQDLASFLSLNLKLAYDFKNLLYSPGIIVESLALEDANIVFIDFTTLKDSNILLKEVNFIKNIDQYKHILFAGIYKDDLTPNQKSLSFISGVQIGFIKGSELESFFSDCLLMALDYPIKNTSYAQAKLKNVNLEIEACSSISKLNKEKLFIETDLTIGQTPLSFKIPFFEELKDAVFKIKGKNKCSSLYPLLDSLELSYPLAGPWDEPSTQNIQIETIETWLESNKTQLKENLGFLYVLGSPNESLNDFLGNEERSTFSFKFIHQISDNFNETLTKDSPPIIYLNLNDQKTITLDTLADIINHVKMTSYNPILIIFNTLSKTEALKKVYGYNNIFCIQSKMNYKFIDLFLNSYLENKKETLKCMFYTFKCSDPNRIIEIPHNIKVTSLNEHQVTFTSEIELPMFSVFHTKRPISCFFTIVPFDKNSNEKKQKNLYKGYIHSISEEQKQKLRKYVNQIIYTPIESFSNEEISKENLPQVDENKMTPEEQIQKTEISNIAHNKLYRRPPIKGKSKL